MRRAKRALTVPVIGSLNAVSTGGWVSFARLIQEAGADALELNVSYVPTDPDRSAGDVEQMYVDLVRDVRAHVSIPTSTSSASRSCPCRARTSCPSACTGWPC